ncbi:hypothetical protein SpCBS45565_g04188 [Spizellomyces sp. 'palustris']|nr:hypothetical protein SpCBS45565_g04188 [Spizellomyces sp. 'palustris']
MHARPLTIITGGNRGLGYELSHQLFKIHHHDILLTARDINKAREAATRVSSGVKNGNVIRAAQLDVSSSESILRFVSDELDPLLASLAQQGNGQSLVTLVNNAGVYGQGWRETLVTNVVGPGLLSRKFLENLPQTLNGRIVNLTSGMGNAANLPSTLLRQLEEQPPKSPIEIVEWAENWKQDETGHANPYSLSKHLLNYLTELYAKEEHGRGIAVIAVDPGWVQTEMGGPGAPGTIQQGVDRMLAQVLADEHESMKRSGKVFGGVSSAALYQY